MKESTLFKIALICSLAGILLLIFISERLELPISNISSIEKSSLEDKVKISGTIEKVIETNGLYILDVKDNTGIITVMIFKEEPLQLKQGTLIEVQGTITEYKGKIEINAESIKIQKGL